MTSQPRKLFEKGATVHYETCNHGFRWELEILRGGVGCVVWTLTSVVRAKQGWNCRDYSSDYDGDGIDNRDDDDDDGDGITDDDDDDHEEGDYDDECYKTDLEEMDTIHTRFGSLVENCCEIDGYMDIGECKGTDREVFQPLWPDEGR